MSKRADGTRVPNPRTSTERNRRRNHRAARILGGIALDHEHDRLLREILAGTGETAAAWVRRMIRDQLRQSRS